MSLLSKALKFMYTSLQYKKEEDISTYCLHVLNDESIIIFEIKENVLKIEWAVNEKGPLLKAIKELLRLHSDDIIRVELEFVPEAFLNDLIALGFFVSCEWIDFWLDDLRELPSVVGCEDSIRKIRAFEHDEASAVTRLCKGFSRGYTGETADWSKKWAKQGHSDIFVALRDDKIIGVCYVSLYGFDRKEGIILWLREIAVHPEYHSNKTGLNLMLYALKWGRENNAQSSFLACDRENTKAIRLYEGLGYRRKDGPSQINMARTMKSL